MQKLALFLVAEKGYTCLKSLIAGEKVSNVGCVFSFNENNVVHSWKDNLPSIFEDVTTETIKEYTEAEIMMQHGYARVFDSGVIRWEYYTNKK